MRTYDCLYSGSRKRLSYTHPLALISCPDQPSFVAAALEQACRLADCSGHCVSMDIKYGTQACPVPPSVLNPEIRVFSLNCGQCLLPPLMGRHGSIMNTISIPLDSPIPQRHCPGQHRTAGDHRAVRATLSPAYNPVAQPNCF